MTGQEILDIAMAQSAEDIGCQKADLQKNEPVIVDSVIGQGARVYYQEPIGCNFVSYGSNVVAATKPELRDVVEEYVHKFEWYRLFETPNALWLNERLAERGHKLCFMAEYFLPDLHKLKRLSCPYEIKPLERGEFEDLYLPQWGNAISKERRHLDVLCYGAYHGEKLVGLAGCSADCRDMWQIGIDVLPPYRGQGIAAALTSNLAAEVLERGKVPFYCCAWSNIPSARNAVKSGFVPAWVELTVKPSETVDQMNR